MQLSFAHVKSLCADISHQGRPVELIDLLLLNQNVTEQQQSLNLTLDEGANLDQKLLMAWTCLDCVTKHGVDDQLIKIMRSMLSTENLQVSKEGFWSSVGDIYEAIKKFIIDLLKRIWNWLRGVKEQTLSVVPLIHGRLKAIYNGPPTFPITTLLPTQCDRDKFDNTQIDAYNAAKFLGFNPADHAPAFADLSSPLGILVYMTSTLLMAKSIGQLYSLCSNSENQSVGTYVSQVGKDQALINIMAASEQAKASGTMKSLGWTPELVIDLAAFLSMRGVHVQDRFKVYFSVQPDSTPLVEFEQTLHTVHSKIVEPELKNIQEQCDTIIRTLRGSDRNTVSRELEEDMLRRRRQAATVTAFLNSLSGLHNVVMTTTVRMLNTIVPPGKP